MTTRRVAVIFGCAGGYLWGSCGLKACLHDPQLQVDNRAPLKNISASMTSCFNGTMCVYCSMDALEFKDLALPVYFLLPI